jgi:undecaprenyl-diphosphatase
MALSYLEASVIGLMQGVTELFPVSSLGHSVLLPALIGGSWSKDLDVSASESPYLSFIVGLHVATALALVLYFWRDWVRLVGGLLTSIRDRRIETVHQRLAWLLVAGTILVGLVGLVFEHPLRTRFATPESAGIFLAINGVLLFLGEGLRRRSVNAMSSEDRDRAEDEVVRASSGAHAAETVDLALVSDRRLAKLSWLDAVLIGGAQIGALFAGISRSGVSMTSGLLRGLSHEDAARFAFLLATPVILAAGALKAPELTHSYNLSNDPAHPAYGHIYGQVLVGSVLSGVAAFVSVHFLSRYFEKRTMTPFAIYSLIAGVACAIRFA